jgi:hypothetical protein
MRLTPHSSDTRDLSAQLALLRDTYNKQPQDEARRLAYALRGMTKLWATLPDRRRPDTVLSIFDRTYDENFISSYLAYVIDPARNGIGAEPLRRLLELAGADTEALDLESVTITREYDLGRYGRIDLLIQVGDRAVLGLENKVLAAEGVSQTAKYAESIARAFPDRDHYFLYLTRDGSKASSRKFIPLSYRRLLDAFAAIRHDGSGNVKKRMLWEDFLEHLRVYIALGEDMMELSEKAKMYVENYKMIKDLTRTFEREADVFFNYFRDTLAAGLPADEWKMTFYSTRGYQYFQRPSWDTPKLYIYYQYYTSREAIIQDSFTFMIDVIHPDAEQFFDLFKPRYTLLKGRYEQLDLTYRPNNRPQALAWKSYPLDGDPDNIVKQLLHAYEEFAFLTPIIDETLAEYHSRSEFVIPNS